MTQHTPGPWTIEKGMLPVMVATIIAPGSKRDTRLVIAHIDNTRGFLGDPDANARLIAAAPELLEALKIAYPYVVDRAADSVHKRVEAAIAKAESTT